MLQTRTLRRQHIHIVPSVVMLAGPNGAGKTSTAPLLLRDELRVAEFVNADVIARGLSAFSADATAVEAGRIMLRRLDDLAKSGVDFAFETTLSGLTLLGRLTGGAREVTPFASYTSGSRRPRQPFNAFIVEFSWAVTLSPTTWFAGATNGA